MARQIVLARVDYEKVVATPGRPDVGQPPRFRDAAVAKALMWVRDGDDVDIAKARAHAAREGYVVYAYPTDERDPLGRARADALAAVRSL